MYIQEDFSYGRVLDFRDIPETNCYCSDTAARELKSRLEGISPDGIHHIDSGDYHYLTLFFASKITEAFHLVLIDNHPDDQSGAFDQNLLSCGSWLKEARKTIPLMVKDSRIFRTDDIQDDSLPIYLSIDLDILSKNEFSTDWDQGNMTPEYLMTILRKLSDRKVIGVDICGGLTEEKGAGPRDLTRNKYIRTLITGLLSAH